MTLPRLHTMNEVIDALGVSRQTVRGLIESGALPAVKVGAQWRFRADAVDQLIADQQQPTAPARKLRSVGGAA